MPKTVLPETVVREAAVLSSLRTSLPVAQVVILALAAGFCSGCLPLRFTTSPGATGTVLDARTRSPISGAEVVISHSTYPPTSPDNAFTNSRPPEVRTNQGGQFSVPLEQRLDLYVLPIDIFPRFGLLVIKRDGYQTLCVPFWSHAVADLGEISMRPAGP